MSDKAASSKIPWIIAVIAILVAVYFALQHDRPNRDDHGSGKPGKIELPKQWNKDTVSVGFIIGKDPDNTVFVVDSEGNELKTCKTCSPDMQKRYGPSCEKAPAAANICKAMKSVLPLENKTITIIHGRGSDCWFVYPSGDEMVGFPSGCNAVQ